MAGFNRNEVILQMKSMGIVPIFYHADPQVGRSLVKACYDAGIRVIEFTNRGDYAHEVFADLTKFSAREYPDLILGAGSIVEPGTASLYLQLGASFIVSPVLNPEIGKVCNRRKVAWIPGCGSVSEISFAEECGASLVKLYPAKQLGGPAFLKAIKGPCPWSEVMVTGGVSLSQEDLKDWFEAGVDCLGVGSVLFSSQRIRAGDYSSITQELRIALEVIRQIKKK